MCIMRLKDAINKKKLGYIYIIMEYPIYNKTLSYDDKFVKYWLLGLLLLLLLMILIGGLTRLTDSGLSITNWQPIIGAIPL